MAGTVLMDTCCFCQMSITEDSHVLDIICGKRKRGRLFKTWQNTCIYIYRCNLQKTGNQWGHMGKTEAIVVDQNHWRKLVQCTIKYRRTSVYLSVFPPHRKAEYTRLECGNQSYHMWVNLPDSAMLILIKHRRTCKMEMISVLYFKKLYLNIYFFRYQKYLKKDISYSYM